MAAKYDEQLAFHDQLYHFYRDNRGKIRRRYKELTRKFLDYNDRESNPGAFLRKPQFEALELYVFIKEFMNNAQVYDIFDAWRKRVEDFDDASYYGASGQTGIFDELSEKQTDALFKQMRQYAEDYPNYIYALAMGLGKTILMATCIFYEFLLSNKYPRDERYCHNALVFAPDKTVLQSLKEIMTFDKSLVVPPEYADRLNSNIKFHFLDDTATALNTLDDSDFNIIISNTQKIIIKKKRKEETVVDRLFRGSMSPALAAVYGDLEDNELIRDDTDLMINQRFSKLCRLKQLGIYVDEAHHLFGADLEKQLRVNSTQTSLRSTINILAKDLVRRGTSVVGCFNYTGTPYVKNQVLPEVVYAYGLQESIIHGFLKDAEIKGYENVKSEEFLKEVIKHFWVTYGEEKRENLLPKLAIFASTIEEANDEVKPMVEEILARLDIPISKILVNVGDSVITKPDDIRNFNNLDVVGTEGSKKQFIILVGKGREGWNCRSLFGVALFRSPKSKIFVLQATMRCLRKITDEQQKATVYLSKDNLEILDAELNKNFNMDIKDFGKTSTSTKMKYEVKVVPPPRFISLKRIWHEYEIVEKELTGPIDFGLTTMDYSKYAPVVYEKTSLKRDMTIKESTAAIAQSDMQYSLFSLTGELARLLNISCLLLSQILTQAVDTPDLIVSTVNKYNEVIADVLVPIIFNSLYEISSTQRTEDRELLLLREPEDKGWYTFSAKPELVIKDNEPTLSDVAHKSFHADTYCFDSHPEMECFQQYIASDRVQEIYFTGMFTSQQGELAIQYYDPESQRIRYYYPDFVARMDTGNYELIEVKGDNKFDDVVVQAKAEATREIASASGMEYVILLGSEITKSYVV